VVGQRQPPQGVADIRLESVADIASDSPADITSECLADLPRNTQSRMSRRSAKRIGAAHQGPIHSRTDLTRRFQHCCHRLSHAAMNVSQQFRPPFRKCLVPAEPNTYPAGERQGLTQGRRTHAGVPVGARFCRTPRKVMLAGSNDRAAPQADATPDHGESIGISNPEILISRLPNSRMGPLSGDQHSEEW
jgi:hypothetical protein